ncbi:MAG: GNAT family N-acetyltransferase [Kineosporiaceae bacterium]
MSVDLRLITPDDAAATAELLRRDAAFLAPWEPEREEDFATVEGQQRALERSLADHAAGLAVPWVVLEDGGIVGRITLFAVVRGALQSGTLGYWVTQARNGRGIATAAVAAALRVAFGELGLHRVQADTLVHNVTSQRVLQRNGFQRIGLAPQYLRIAGRWQDCYLHQRLAGPAGPSAQ